MSNVEAKPVRAKDLLNAIVDEHYKSAWEAKNAGEKVGWLSLIHISEPTRPY